MKKVISKYLYLTAFAVAIVCFLILLITDSIIVLLSPGLILKIVILLVASVLMSAILTIGVSIMNPVLSDTMATLRRMLRVESLSNPLLLRMSSEAPGTYHHSMNVSSLAQKAAKSIGADALLVRSAAYYHDIGKLDNPHAYVENQSGIEVPTSENAESIRRDAKEIISHVEKGIKIAQENKLPDEIIDLIRQHHGTTCALYFYVIAKERGLKIKKTDLRYSGPTPQSKEAAILMLADCVEATAKAQQVLTPEKIESIVGSTIEERLADKQFKSSGLSDLDLAKIKTAMKETLRSIYHQRIEYGTKESPKN